MKWPAPGRALKTALAFSPANTNYARSCAKPLGERRRRRSTSRKMATALQHLVEQLLVTTRPAGELEEGCTATHSHDGGAAELVAGRRRSAGPDGVTCMMLCCLDTKGRAHLLRAMPARADGKQGGKNRTGHRRSLLLANKDPDLKALSTFDPFCLESLEEVVRAHRRSFLAASLPQTCSRKLGRTRAPPHPSNGGEALHRQAQRVVSRSSIQPQYLSVDKRALDLAKMGCSC